MFVLKLERIGVELTLDLFGTYEFGVLMMVREECGFLGLDFGSGTRVIL